jgi:hypothetical protein
MMNTRCATCRTQYDADEEFCPECATRNPDYDDPPIRTYILMPIDDDEDWDDEDWDEICPRCGGGDDWCWVCGGEGVY